MKTAPVQLLPWQHKQLLVHSSMVTHVIHNGVTHALILSWGWIGKVILYYCNRRKSKICQACKSIKSISVKLQCLAMLPLSCKQDFSFMLMIISMFYFKSTQTCIFFAINYYDDVMLRPSYIPVRGSYQTIIILHICFTWTNNRPLWAMNWSMLPLHGYQFLFWYRQHQSDIPQNLHLNNIIVLCFWFWALGSCNTQSSLV